MIDLGKENYQRSHLNARAFGIWVSDKLRSRLTLQSGWSKVKVRAVSYFAIRSFYNVS